MSSSGVGVPGRFRVRFSVQAASLPELALALTDYTVMRRMAAHILIKAHSACNRIWDCKRVSWRRSRVRPSHVSFFHEQDTPDFRAQLQHRREVFHPVVDLRRMIHNVFGSSFSSLADYLLRKETHWLGWKGIAVSKVLLPLGKAVQVVTSSFRKFAVHFCTPRTGKDSARPGHPRVKLRLMS